MKSINEFATEYAQDKYIPVQTSQAVKAGANYVLEKIVGIVNKNTKPNGMEDRAKMASDMLILIKQLKK